MTEKRVVPLMWSDQTVVLYLAETGDPDRALLGWEYYADERAHLFATLFVSLTQDEAQAVFEREWHQGVLEPVREQLATTTGLVSVRRRPGTWLPTDLDLTFEVTISRTDTEDAVLKYLDSFPPRIDQFGRRSGLPQLSVAGKELAADARAVATRAHDIAMPNQHASL